MSNVDIVPETLKNIQAEFKKQFQENPTIEAIYKKIKENEVNYEDANEFAIEVGEMLSESLNSFITADTLPEGRMWYNIASRIMEPMLSQNHELISDVCNYAQQTTNQKSGVTLKSIKPTLNQNKIDGFVDKLSSAKKFEEVEWMLGEPVVNYSQSIVDDSIRENMEFHAKSGLSPKIVRKLGANETRTAVRGKTKTKYKIPCRWCESLAGVWNYLDMPDFVADNIFRRHEYCRCTVEYVSDGKRQDVWSKKFVEEQEQDKEERQERISALEKKAKSIEEQKKDFVQSSQKLPFQFEITPNFKDEVITEAIYKARDTLEELSGKFKNFLRKVERGAGSGGAVAGVDVAGNMHLGTLDIPSVIHEFAHTIAQPGRDDFGISNDSDFWKEINAIRKENRKAIKKDISNQISDYAMNGGNSSRGNLGEYMAEAFAMAYENEMGISGGFRHKANQNNLQWAYKVYDVILKYFGK